MASKMNPIDFVKSYFAALEGKNYDYVRDNSTEDMHFSGPIPQPVDRQGFVEMERTLFRAFPDWKFNLSNFKQVGDRVIFQSHITATHSGVLNMPAMDIHNYQPTGKHLRLPVQETTVELRDGKVAKLDVKKTAGGGVNDLLEQIGYPITQQTKTK
jgi:predicted ester cyclase